MARRLILNILGGALGVAGIVLLIIDDARLILWLTLAFIGAVVYGGLPSKRALRLLLHLQPVTLLLAASFFIYSVKRYGWDDMVQTLVATFVVLFIIDSLVLGTAKALLNQR